jgi:hypothetical protein
LFGPPRRIGHCDLPFDSFDLEALDRLAQGGGKSIDSAQDREPAERLAEPFGIWVLLFEISYLLKSEHRHLKSDVPYNILSE